MAQHSYRTNDGAGTPHVPELSGIKHPFPISLVMDGASTVLSALRAWSLAGRSRFALRLFPTSASSCTATCVRSLPLTIVNGPMLRSHGSPPRS